MSDDSTAQFMAGLYQLVENRGITYSQAINEMKRAFVRRQVLMEASDLTRGVQIMKHKLEKMEGVEKLRYTHLSS